MQQFRDDRHSILDQLQRAGLMDVSELNDFKAKQEVGAGKLPAQRTGMAPMVTSVPQADR